MHIAVATVYSETNPSVSLARIHSVYTAEAQRCAKHRAIHDSDVGSIGSVPDDGTMKGNAHPSVLSYTRAFARRIMHADAELWFRLLVCFVCFIGFAVRFFFIIYLFCMIKVYLKWGALGSRWKKYQDGAAPEHGASVAKVSSRFWETP